MSSLLPAKILSRTEQQMNYEIVEDLKKIKANVPLFEMCKVPQQKERLLRALEESDEKPPTDNQPQDKEEIGETSVGGESKCKHPPSSCHLKFLIIMCIIVCRLRGVNKFHAHISM